MDDNVDADRERLQEALTPGTKKKKEMRDRDDKKFQSEEEEEVDWERLLWGEGTVDDNGQGQELQPSFLTPGANKKWGPDDQKSQMEILEADNDCWIEERKDYPQEEEDEVVDWERIHFDEGTVDDNVQGQELQPSVMGGIQMPSQIMIPSTPITPSQLPSPLVQYQLSSYLQSQQQQLQQSSHKLKVVWSNQHNEILKISSAADFKNHILPLARIKNIMKSDEDVRMIALEVLVLFVKACEMFILELTYRSWAQTEENKRRMLMKNDIARAIQKTEVFDFLVDIVPREEPKDEMLGTLGDEYCHDQELQTTVKGGIQMPYTPAPFHTSVMMSSTTPIMPGQLPSPIVLPQLSYQQIQPQLAQQLKMFWYNQYNEILAISSANVFKDHNLSLARIKKIMKSSEDPTMKMALEVPVLFARACGMFIQELTYRAWAENVENKRQKLSKKDIVRAITKSEVFDFLVDIVPRESSG